MTLTALDIIEFANSKGEIGYCRGGKDEHLPLFKEAEQRGWIRFGYTMRRPDWHPNPQTSDIYYVTDAGRSALSERSSN